ncbi:phage tail protein [Staphylococcus pseudintermedius]|nr:phage tail protein [Staphylococcus pseudintermedius]
MGSYTVGFKKLYVGVFDEDAENIVKRFIWQDEKGGTVNLDITGLSPDMIDMYASNKRVWMKKEGTNSVKSDLDLFNIPTDQLDYVLGRTEDTNGSSWVGETTRAPYVAMIGESETGVDGKPVYVALLKGIFSLDSMKFKTKGEKEEAPEPTKLTGDWMMREVEIGGTTSGYVFAYHEGTNGVEEFFNKVFVGFDNTDPNASSVLP